VRVRLNDFGFNGTGVPFVPFRGCSPSARRPLVLSTASARGEIDQIGSRAAVRAQLPDRATSWLVASIDREQQMAAAPGATISSGQWPIGSLQDSCDARSRAWTQSRGRGSAVEQVLKVERGCHG